jgi:hypothetical protein
MDNRVTAVSFFLEQRFARLLRCSLRHRCATACALPCAAVARLLRHCCATVLQHPPPDRSLMRRARRLLILLCVARSAPQSAIQSPPIGALPAGRRRPASRSHRAATNRSEPQRAAAPHPHAGVRRSLRRQARGWSEERRSEAAGRSLRRPEASDGDRSAGRRGRSRRSGCQNSPRGVYRPSLVECVPPVGGVVPAERGATRALSAGAVCGRPIPCRRAVWFEGAGHVAGAE